MKKILLTGGSGFIGRNIIESHLSDKYEILAPSHKELAVDDEKSVENFFSNNKIDIVIHSAAKAGHRNSKDSHNLFYTNTRMFFNLERYSNNYEKMIVIGSGAIYDMRNYRPKMSEHEYLDNIPVDEHGFSKYVCEKVIEKSENIYDLRVFGVFGKYEDYSIRFISNLICKALYGLPLTMNQDRFFDFIYIDDLIKIIDYFINNKIEDKSFNITPDKSSSLKSIAQLILDISNSDLPIVVKKTGLGHEYSGNNSKLKTLIPDFKFESLEDSINKLYHWYSSNINLIDKNLLLVDK